MRGTSALGALLSIILIISIASPAGAESSPVPRDPNVVDMAGDANYLYLTDQSAPFNRPEADILAAWFTSDGRILDANWHVAANPLDKDVAFRLSAVPTPNLPVDTRYHYGRCLSFTAVFPASDDPWEPYGHGEDRCSESALAVLIAPQIRELRDGSTVITSSFPLARHFPVRAGDVLAKPRALVSEFTVDPVTSTYRNDPRIDATEAGRDYRVPATRRRS